MTTVGVAPAYSPPTPLFEALAHPVLLRNILSYSSLAEVTRLLSQSKTLRQAASESSLLKLTRFTNKNLSLAAEVLKNGAVTDTDIIGSFPEALAAAGFYDKAIETASSMNGTDDGDDNLFMKGQLLHNIAAYQAKAGLYDKAIETTNMIENEDFKQEALSEIAKAQAEAGFYDEAIATANTIENGHEKVQALCKITKIQAKDKAAPAVSLESFQSAFEVNNIQINLGKANAFYTIAKAQAEVGFYAEAMSTTSMITRADEKVRAMCEIIKLQSKDKAAPAVSRESFRAVFEVANNIQDNFNRACALSEIAKAQAEVGFYEKAM
jgi:tetratricopeptide (TPR) repeat protein